jgi:fructose-bisphosphate aldolase class I
MQDVIQKLLTSGKGILALDWSPNTIAQKFLEVGITSTPETNRQYRQMLITTEGIENYISGVIFHEETAKQILDNGLTFPNYLIQKGIVPGIKVDQGGERFGTGDEEITSGLSGLSDRLKEYYQLGLRFTKWRALFKISDIYPSKEFLDQNLNRLCEFAKVSIENGLVPVMEPEVSMKGNHTTTRCAEITTQVLTVMFEKLLAANVDLKNIILKTNMVLPGQDNGIKAAPLEVAEATLRVLRKSVPSVVPGVVFLSGGQSPEDATQNLNEIIKRKNDASWQLTFSFARALQGEALSIWKGDSNNVANSQKAFLDRLDKVTKARRGEL